MATAQYDCMKTLEEMARDLQTFLKTNPTQEEMHSKLMALKDELWEERNNLAHDLGYR